MGLDMYLNVSERITNWNFEKETKGNNDRFDAIIEASGLKVRDANPVLTLSNTEIYWRKANQIHGWFINNCAGGEDNNCEDIKVSRDDLVELYDTCTVLLNSKSRELAMEMLPPTPGFFFGTYEIDDWYWQDIEETHTKLGELLDRITEENKWNYEIEYYASW